MEPLKNIDVLINGGMILSMNNERQVIDNGTIAISGDTITHVFSSDQLSKNQTAKKTINAEGMVVIPGLINAHSHLAMTLFRGLLEDLELHRWLEKVWKYELSSLNEENVRAGSKLALAEMIRGGVTCAHDMYWHYEETMALSEEIGFRLISGPPITGIGGLDFDSMVAHSRKVLENARKYHYVFPNQIVSWDYNNSLSIGFDIETRGHVFQLFFTNSYPLFERGILTETIGEWKDGEIYLGFNISRTFTIVRPKDYPDYF